MKKILAIIHDIHADISDETIYKTLTNHYGECHFEAIRFDKINLDHGDHSELAWQTLKAKQEKYYEDIIAPKIKEDADRQLVYFGLAPIPLCMHLGFLIGGIIDVCVFQHHHDNKNWHWSGQSTEKPLIKNLPKEQFDVDGDVVLRFGTFTQVKELETEGIIERPIRSIDIHPENTDRDLMGSFEDAKDYAKVFFDTLMQLKENLPLFDELHLFAAVPCGLAFLMGTEIQPNVHKPIVVYHFVEKLTPPYIEAFCIQEKGGENLIISDEEKIELDQFRDELEIHFNDDIHFLIEKQKEIEDENWFRALFPKIQNTLFSSNIWSNLTKISNTSLEKATFQKTPHEEGRNKFFISGKWYLPDSFLFGLKKKFNVDDFKRAIRLFWFHEGIHFSAHNIHSDNSSGLGQYANVLEDADYQSDVYAMLHEFKVSEKEAHKDAPSFFANLIRIATETMLVFDEFSRSDTMEARRVKRYLIWFFQLARIEHVNCHKIEDVLEILSLKPQLDVKLHIRQEEQNRIHFDLKRYKKDEIGIAFFYKNKATTFHFKDGQLSLDQLVDGLRERQIEPVKMVMRQILGELNQLHK